MNVEMVDQTVLNLLYILLCGLFYLYILELILVRLKLMLTQDNLLYAFYNYDDLESKTNNI